MDSDRKQDSVERRRQRIRKIVKDNPICLVPNYISEDDCPKLGATDETDQNTPRGMTSDSDSDEAIYNFVKLSPNGLVFRPKSPEDYVQYIRREVIEKCVELLTEFSYEDYVNPYEFIKIKIPKLKNSLPTQYERDMAVKLFYDCLDQNNFLLRLHRLFQNSRLGSNDDFWDAAGTHNFEIMASIIFFKAEEIEPENLIKILTEIPWKGKTFFYRFLLKKAKKKPGPLKKIMLKEYSQEYTNSTLIPNLRAAKNLLRKQVAVPREKSQIRLPTLNKSVTLAWSSRTAKKHGNEE